MTWLITTLGFVALLIWGLRMVRTAIERFSPKFDESGVTWLANNHSKSASLGMAGGIAMQPGTAVAGIASSFAQRGYLPIAAAVALTLGGDLGSAVVALVLSADLSLAPPLLFFLGVLMFIKNSGRRARIAGRGFIGLGLVFLALSLIGETVSEAKSSELASVVFGALDNDHALSVFVAGLATILAFSSVAVTLLTAELATQAVINFETALFMLAGINAAAVYLSLLAASDLEPTGRQVLQINFFVRLGAGIGALLVLIFVPPEFLLLSSDLAFSLLLLHIALNTITLCLILPALRAICGWVSNAFPATSAASLADQRGAVHLLDSDLDRPDRALSNCLTEVFRVADAVNEMLSHTLEAFQQDELIARVRETDEVVDALHRDVTLYLSRLMRQDLTQGQAARARALFDYCLNLEHIGDIIDHNLMDLAKNKTRQNAKFSSEGWKELTKLHALLLANLRLSLDVVVSEEAVSAQELLDEKRRFRRKSLKSQSNHIKRLNEGVADSISSSELHLDILRDMRRVNSHLASVAYQVLDTGKKKNA